MTLDELRPQLAQALKGTEFSARSWFAGGCVRDHLLDPTQQLKDADIAVELPEGGVRLAAYLKLTLPTDEPLFHKAFGTASSRYGGIQLDFVMTRSERYSPGSRHPRVRFADLRADCLRRDFTVNALYLGITSGEVVDPSGLGLADLRSRTMRCVRDPLRSLDEDPLRILRALRFAVILGFGLDSELRAGILAKAELIGLLSRKRCLQEHGLIMDTGNPQIIGHWMSLTEQLGVWQFLGKKLQL